MTLLFFWKDLLFEYSNITSFISLIYLGKQKCISEALIELFDVFRLKRFQEVQERVYKLRRRIIISCNYLQATSKRIKRLFILIHHDLFNEFHENLIFY